MICCKLTLLLLSSLLKYALQQGQTHVFPATAKQPVKHAPKLQQTGFMGQRQWPPYLPSMQQMCFGTGPV